jgi:hypothetical protein
MHIHAIYAGQVALALTLAARTSGAQNASDSAETRAGRLPFIGASTLLVAAYLRSSLCPKSLADSDRADSHA